MISVHKSKRDGSIKARGFTDRRSQWEHTTKAVPISLTISFEGIMICGSNQHSLRFATLGHGAKRAHAARGHYSGIIIRLEPHLYRNMHGNLTLQANAICKS